MDSIAITDHGSMYGVIDFYKAAKAEGIKPIIGCEVYIAPQSRLDRTDVREIQNHGLEEEKIANKGLIELARKYGLGLVATNDAHYLKREDSEFHDVLLCIQMGKLVTDTDRMTFSSDDYYVKSPEEMAELFPEYPDALANTVKIAERCNVEFDFEHRHLPNFPLPEGMTDEMYLRQLCEERLLSRYPQETEEIRKRLEYELGVIHSMGFDSYFLIVWDFINYAKEKGIAGLPILTHWNMPCFLSVSSIPERVTMPDIDVDFCYVRREEVIEYVKRRYGEDHVAQIATFGTLAAKGALRDVGRALDMSFNEVSQVTKLIPEELGITIDKALKESSDLMKLYNESPQVQRLIDFARDVEGLPRHSSTHAAGIVIARNPLTDYLPVSVSNGTLVTQYDKDHVEELGLLKMDFLGLRTLTVLADAVKNIERARGEKMESSGMTALVKDLHPEGFVDLIPTVALYRPGPAWQWHGNLWRGALSGAGNADSAGAGWIQSGTGRFAPPCYGGTKEKGLPDELAQHIFDLLTHFADYGFNKSHSAAYAYVAWQTAYLKAHYPAEFMAAMLTSIMDTNDKVGVYIEQCHRMGISILPPDINASGMVFSVDGEAIRFGLAAVKNVGEAAIDGIVKERNKNGAFKDLSDFCNRVDNKAVNRRVMESLIKCGAFDSTGAKRSQLLEALEQALNLAVAAQKDRNSGMMGLFDDSVMEEANQVVLKDLLEVPKAVRLTWEKEITGFYITGHPLDEYGNIIRGFTSIEKVLSGQLAEGKTVKLGGMIISAKRITTKKGDTMCFVELEDFTHSIEVVVFPRVFYECVNNLVPDTAVMVQGKVNIVDDGVKLIADNVTLLKDYQPSYYIMIQAENEKQEIYDAIKGGTCPLQGKLSSDNVFSS
ncbi:unnamed protein product [Cylicocyclus nassatus]|uniref:DNA-directed DNA polymerase n=1 Tax=Cylicocyclus nassatus TaxID=53992 RepID=A0AA36GYH8_CYLNA|nr:unnamed protein product [Cylicocyclus nassatus]